jgi:glycogen debranching enzyme
LGGFALGSVDGQPRRRYHAWLIGAASPPVGRVVVLHSCVEWLVRHGPGGERRCSISDFEFGGGMHSPGGTAFLKSFTHNGLTTAWEYVVPEFDLNIKREVTPVPGRNACTVCYTIIGRCDGVRLELRPFMPLRDFHTLEREQSSPAARLEDPLALRVGRHGLEATLQLRAAKSVNAAFVPDSQWWRNFTYSLDAQRGQDCSEDLHSHGYWSVPLSGARSDVELVCELAKPQLPPAKVAPIAPTQPIAKTPAKLMHAASQFVVKRTIDGKLCTSIIAGYPWFSDWGRDTCISLPGLLICTGRLEEARDCLEAFARMVEGGLVPNCFDNGTGHAEYNTADASLWYLNAAAEYAQAAKLPLDPSGELSLIAGACLEIIAAYEHGTGFGIKMDPADGLIMAGDAGTQLTWMDAKRDGVVFTPRHGKPVELSALWYNGLRRVGGLLPASMARRAREISDIAGWSDRSFEGAFWNEAGQCLYDCLAPRYSSDGLLVGWDPSYQLRPNQIFAVSLPFSPLERSMHAAVLAKVKTYLLTPFGLRTLAQDDPAYRPRYEGPLFARDGAYHNGTVWPWLIGPYAEAVLRVGEFSQASRLEATQAISPLLDECCRLGPGPGSVSQLAEIYDAEPPQRPTGCPAQAWSIAELIRVTNLIEFGRAGTTP